MQAESCLYVHPTNSPFLVNSLCLQPGAVDDDILLEVVMFVGVLCNEGTAPLLCSSGLVNTLFVLMGEKKEDDEFVLQIAFAFNKFLMYDETRTALLNHTQVVFYLIDLLQDKNKVGRQHKEECIRGQIRGGSIKREHKEEERGIPKHALI